VKDAQRSKSNGRKPVKWSDADNSPLCKLQKLLIAGGGEDDKTTYDKEDIHTPRELRQIGEGANSHACGTCE